MLPRPAKVSDMRPTSSTDLSQSLTFSDRPYLWVFSGSLSSPSTYLNVLTAAHSVHRLMMARRRTMKGAGECFES